MLYHGFFLFACLFALFAYFYWLQMSEMLCIPFPLISTNGYMLGKRQLTIPIVRENLEYLQVKMMRSDSVTISMKIVSYN